MSVNLSSQPRVSMWRAIFICFLASVFYLYEFTIQVSPGVMTHELMSAFGVTSVGLGTIAAFFYYAYAPMQLPSGILYDRFGPRLLMPIAATICALGAFFFSITHSAIMASYGMFMMGLGAASAFIGVLILIARWFPPQYFAMLAGIAQLMSSVGAVFGEAPLASAVSHFGWRHSMFGLAVIGILLAIIMAVVVRDFPPGHAPKPAKNNRSGKVMKGLKHVLHSKQTWYVAIYSFCVWAPITVLGSLWGVPFIKHLYHTSTTVASSAISMIWIGIGIGSPLVGWISEKMLRRNFPLSVGALFGVISTFIIIYVPHIPFVWMYVLLFCVGLGAWGQSLSFAVIKDISQPKYVGTAVGFNNMAVVAGGALFQPLVGYLLHLSWTGKMFDGAPLYTTISYQKAFWILPICYIIALILSWLMIKETHCRPSFLKNKNKSSIEINSNMQGVNI